MASRVLGLDVAVVRGRLRSYHGQAPLADGRELIERLSRMADGIDPDQAGEPT